MLIGFRLRNFLSYAGEQYFTFASSADPEHLDAHVVATSLRAVPRLSKAAIVVGPNGGGKTNLLLGLSVLRQLVLHAHGLDETQFRQFHAPSGHSGSRGPTEFQIELLLGTTRYRYWIAYNAERVCFEKLDVHSSAKSQRWFERRASGGIAPGEIWERFSSSFFGARETWRRSTGPRDAFLTTAAKLGATQLGELMNWFESGMDIGLGDEAQAPAGLVSLECLQPQYRERLLRMFNDVDIPLSNLRLHRDAFAAAPEARTARPLVALELQHRRPTGNIWVQPKFESTGIKRLLSLFARTLDAIDHQRLLALDEFDLNLHIMIARYLIGLVSRVNAPNNRAQLLVTTHKAVLMDLTMFRRDEIWLAHLDQDKATKLYRLSSLGARKHEAVMKAYLTGRYGAVPTVRAATHAPTLSIPTRRTRSVRPKR